MKEILIIIVFVIVGLSACKKLDSFPDAPLETSDSTKIIMHRGGGMSGKGRNTFDGAIYGMSVADGIELDIQQSKDNTPWLGHDSRIEECDENQKECFINLSDSEIEERINCGDFYTVKLEYIFEEASINYPDAIIVLDCKAWYPCGFSEMNSIRSMKKMGNEIIRLAKIYDLEDNIIIDSGVKAFLKEINKNSNIKIYYRSFASLDKAARNAFDVNADGVSLDQNRFKLTKEEVQLLNQKGLEVQLWTIDNKVELDEVLSLHPQQIFSEVSNE